MLRGFPGINLVLKPALVAGVIAWSLTGVAQNQQAASGAVSKVPDAQVEASVIKALASASDLANQPITTTTVYGVVTLSGTVQTEQMRTEAENLVARTAGVQKVVDEMTLSEEAPNVPPTQDQASTVPESAPQNERAAQHAQAPPLQSNRPYADPENPSDRDYGNPGYPAYPDYPGAPEYGRQQPPPPPGYGSGDSDRQGYGYPQQQPYYGGQRYPAQPTYGGQEAGKNVTVPTGALIRLRIDRPLDSGHAQPGERFDGIVVNDVVADGAVAIPRGATVQGTVVDARSSGSLSGRGELSLQLTSLTLGGNTYPILSDVWAHHGGDKTTETVDHTAIGAGLGGLVGAAAAGGEGAAVGAGIGAALGLGSAASSGRGQVFIPAEGLLTFHLAQPVMVATVSQLEMDRLAQGAGPSTGAQPRLQRRVYAAPYYGPAYTYPYPYYGYPYRRFPY
jgi:hypothetical protein